MSNELMKHCRRLKLPPTQKGVLMAMADIANDDHHGELWPSIATLAEYTCYGRTAVIDAIKALEIVGLVSADRSNGRHTRYTINVAADLFSPPNVVRLPDRSEKRTGPPSKPVRETDRSVSQTNRSASRTGPVRQADTNHNLPLITQLPATRGTRMSVDWFPKEETAEAMRREYPSVNQSEMLADFRDYWRAQSGAKGLSNDWDALYRIRIRQLARAASAKLRPAAARVSKQPKRQIDREKSDLAQAEAIAAISKRLKVGVA